MSGAEDGPQSADSSSDEFARESAPDDEPPTSSQSTPGRRTEGAIGQDPEQPEDPRQSNQHLLVYDIVIPILAVLLLGGYLIAITGVWPPMVAIESGSMEPNMNINDLVIVMDTDRFQPHDAQGETGIVTAERGATSGYSQFGYYGDVIVYEPNGNSEATPVIHRAMLWVEAGDNWVDRANDDYLGNADTCDDLRMCPAPHDGFITKGDNNRYYDQVQSDEPVRPAWVIGTAEHRLPGLGWLRLRLL